MPRQKLATVYHRWGTTAVRVVGAMMRPVNSVQSFIRATTRRPNIRPGQSPSGMTAQRLVTSIIGPRKTRSASSIVFIHLY